MYQLCLRTLFVEFDEFSLTYIDYTFFKVGFRLMRINKLISNLTIMIQYSLTFLVACTVALHKIIESFTKIKERR